MEGKYLFDHSDELDGFPSFVEKLHYQLRSLQTTPTDLVKKGWEIAEKDKTLPERERLNAVVYGQQWPVIQKTAREHAHNSDIRYKIQQPRGILDGIPLAVKDISGVRLEGCETTNGSWFGEPIQDTTAIPVRNLREAGAIVIARTTTSEYGYKGSTSSIRYGVTRNPVCPWLTPGGSSGGSAATVGNGMAPVALGSDGGGSVRIPAACCGLVGFKPSFGVVSNTGKISTLSHVGPLTNTVRDAAIAMDVMQLVDECDRDGFTLGVPHDFEFLRQCDTQLRENDVSRLNIAVSLTLGGTARDVDPQVTALVRRAVEEVVRPIVKSVTYVDEELADIVHEDHHGQFGVMWLSKAASNKMLVNLSPNDVKKLDPGLHAYATLGRSIPGVDVVRAKDYGLQLKQDMIKFHQKYDILITPTLATLPITANTVYDDIHDLKTDDGTILKNVPKWSPGMFTSIFNVTQQPAASINCGFAKSNPNSPGKGKAMVPVGMQIVGGLYKDDVVMKVCYAVEQAMLKAQRNISKL